MLEQLKREQQEELEKVQHHLDPIEKTLKDLEENIRELEKARSATEKTTMTQVMHKERALFRAIMPQANYQAENYTYILVSES